MGERSHILATLSKFLNIKGNKYIWSKDPKNLYEKEPFMNDKVNARQTQNHITGEILQIEQQQQPQEVTQ